MKVFVLVLIAVCVFWTLGCTHAPKPAASSVPPPATIQNKVKESDLTRVLLTEAAEQRLGIEVAEVKAVSTYGAVTVIGDVVPIPGRSIIVSAPASGLISKFRFELVPGMQIAAGRELFQLTPLVAPQRDLKLTLQADIETTKARLDNAKLQANRAKQLLRDMAGSQRNVDIAQQELAQANAAYEAATERFKRVEAAPLDADVNMSVTAPSNGILRQLQVAQGQSVNAGAPLFELADFSKVWLRVPVYAADLKNLSPAGIAEIRDVDGAGATWQGHRVNAPPTADPLTATADLYYEIDNPRTSLRPGQRLEASLPTRSAIDKAFSIPKSAILYDVHGGAWVYVAEGDRKYRRQRVEVYRASGQSTLVSRGLVGKLRVVSAGAAELFGTEFGAGH